MNSDAVAPAATNSVADIELDPRTLRFRDGGLEALYRRFYVRQVINTTRFGVVLTISLYLGIGFLDFWTMPDRVQYTAPLRLAMLLVLSAVLAASWRASFIRNQQRIMFAMIVLLGINIAALLAVMPPRLVNQHYVSLLLIIFGSYTLLGLRFPYTLAGGVLVIIDYAVVEVFFRGNAWYDAAVNLLILQSTVLLSCVGSYTADRQRRIAWFRHLQVQRQREESHYRALHDALTGLPNRRLLEERLSRAMERARRYGKSAAVLFIDLDAFKPVNDVHGHAFGDQLLRAVARQLTRCVRTTDTVARIGGDEFVVLLEDMQQPDDVAITVQRIEAAFDAPLDISGTATPIRFSLGTAVFPRDGDDAQRLLEMADQAMYHRKRRRGMDV